MAKQINALTSTRAIAALMVVVFHFSGGCFPFNTFPTFFYHGALAVSYFFVLSGFVLYTAYEEKNISYGAYIKRRIARIVPVYLLALSLIICAGYFIYRTSVSPAYIKLIMAHALLLQAYIPDYSMNLNLPGWTLSVEMCFYLLFPLLLVLFRKRPAVFIATTITLYIISQAVHLHYYPLRHVVTGDIIDVVFFNPVIHMNQFLIGMCGGRLFNKMKMSHKNYKWLLVCASVVVLSLMGFLSPAISCHVGLIAPVFMVFIVSLSLNDPTLLNARPLVFLGEISYGIYILQLPVYSFCTFANGKYMHLQPMIFFYLFLCMLILAASASFFFLEKPLMKMVGSRQTPKQFKNKTLSV